MNLMILERIVEFGAEGPRSADEIRPIVLRARHRGYRRRRLLIRDVFDEGIDPPGFAEPEAGARVEQRKTRKIRRRRRLRQRRPKVAAIGGVEARMELAVLGERLRMIEGDRHLLFRNIRQPVTGNPHQIRDGSCGKAGRQDGLRIAITQFQLRGRRQRQRELRSAPRERADTPLVTKPKPPISVLDSI